MNVPEEKRAELFHKFEVFDGLTAEEIDQVAECAELLELETGEELMTEGARNRDLFGLIAGRVEVLKSGDSGEPRKITELQPHAAFGELGLAVGAPRSATIRTLEPSEFLHVDGDGFHHLQTGHTSAAYKVEHNILRILARRLASMNRELLQVSEDAID